MRHYLLLSLAFLLWQGLAWCAPVVAPVILDKDTVHLGDTRGAIRKKLGLCTGYLYSRPEILQMGSPPAEPVPGAPPRYTMILVDSAGNESELPLAGAVAPTGVDQRKDLPTWAYLVHVPFLALNQEQWIYSINRFYSVGIVFDGKTDEAKATDIIACTLEPFLQKYNRVTRKYEPAGLRKEQYNLRRSGSAKDVRVCTTGDNITLGSTYRDLLMSHGWTRVQIPFVTKEISRRDDTPSDMVKPIGDLILNDPNAAPSQYPLPAGMLPNNAQGFGSFLAKFFNPDSPDAPYISSGFSPDMLVVYEQAHLSYTVVNHTVVRIHIGQGAGPLPPPPPDPNAVAPDAGVGAGGAGMGGGEVMPPIDGTTTAPPAVTPDVKPNGGTKLPPTTLPGAPDLPDIGVI